MKFNLLYNSLTKKGEPAKTGIFFKNACKELGVEFVGYDFHSKKDSINISDVQELSKGDLLYRATNNPLAKTVEQLMINDECSHFYKRWKTANGTRGTSWFIHKKYNLPAIPSFPGIPDSEEERNKVVEELGGFPIIVKVVGNSLGVGVMRIDSMQSLVSVLDFLETLKRPILLRKYIDHRYYVRAVVVGESVVASHAAYTFNGEFRTNVGDCTFQKRKIVTLEKKEYDIAVQAVHTMGIETGGVDLLFDSEGEVYISEVNFPNDFTDTQKVTGIDIAKSMVEYLLKKSTLK